MKRERQNDDDSFRISPDTTCSNPHTNNNQNVTLSTTHLANINTHDDSPNATKGSSRDNKNNNKEQDRFLPIANVGRIMRKAVPGNAKFSKDAKETVQECVSEFISFVTGEASEKCQREKRKTINGDDILWAIMTLGFEDYVNPLKLYLAKYRDVEGEKLNVPKRQRLQLDQELDVSFNNVYTSTSLIPQPPFPLPFSQSSMQTTTQDHIDEHNW